MAGTVPFLTALLGLLGIARPPVRLRPAAARAARAQERAVPAPPEPGEAEADHAPVVPAAPLLLNISRSEIEALDVGPAVQCLDRWQQTPVKAMESRGRVRFSLHGYRQDPRELHRIDEVRDYFTGLLLAFPPWFFFADPNGDALRVLALSTCRLSEARGGRPVIHPDELGPFAQAQLRSLRTYGQKIRLPVETMDQLGAAALGALAPLAGPGGRPLGGRAA